jgi:rSAM/selenodomain-associated transferase 1
MTASVTLIVLAKEPVAGRVKTRLCPPCGPEQAAAIATAALADTLDIVAAATAGRRVLALDGRAPAWVPGGFEVVAQRGEGLAERLAAAFDDVGGPALLIGMDTPQVTVSRLHEAMRALMSRHADAVVGPALDGGYWAIGLRQPDASVFEGVPMSTALTGRAQLERLRALGRRVALVDALRDVDTYDDALAVALDAPTSRFARTLALVHEEFELACPA